jgi:hypothetical protein
VAVQHSHSGKISLRKKFELFSMYAPVEGPVFTVCHYTFEIKTIIFIYNHFKCLLPPNSKRTYLLKQLLPGAQGLQKHPMLNPQPHPSQLPLHHHLLQYAPLLPLATIASKLLIVETVARAFD